MNTRSSILSRIVAPSLSDVVVAGFGAPLQPGRMIPRRDPEGHGSGNGGTGTGGTGGDGSGQGGNGDGGQGGTGQGGQQGGQGGSGQGQPNPNDMPNQQTFTREQVSEIVEQRIGQANRQFEQRLQQAREDAGKDQVGRLEAERDRANTRAEAVAKNAGPKVAQALAQVAAVAAGGRADRAKAIVRQADLDGVVTVEGDEFAVDDTKLTAAVEKVLSEYPEWKAEQGGGSGDGNGSGGGAGGNGGQGDGQQRQHSSSGGDLNGGSGGGEKTLDEFKRLNMAERSELRAQDPEQYRRLADAEIAEKSTPRR